MLLIDIIRAQEDPDLRMRVVAAAALAGERDPETWQYEHRYSVVAAPINADPGAQVLADVYVYARDGAHVPDPGMDPTIVTDDYIKHAVLHVRALGL